MPKLIEKPVLFQDDAVRGDEIREYVGKISTKTDEISIGLLSFPEGWSEPPQTPDFDEYSVVLEGTLCVETETMGTILVRPNQTVFTPKGERIQYRTPYPGGAKYLAVCLPAFAPEQTHREAPGATSTPKTEFSARKSRVRFFRRPTAIRSVGMKSKQIDEFVGPVGADTTPISIARVILPEGWADLPQKADFAMYQVVLRGELHAVQATTEPLIARPGQAIAIPAKTWIQFRAPRSDGVEYLSICLPAFDPYRLHCDEAADAKPN